MKRVSVLFLEDNPLDFELAQNLFTEANIEVDMLQTSYREEFVNALIKKPFDVILMDFTLPSFDGLTALDLVKQNQPDTPVIMFSGTIGEENAIECIKRGAVDYVLKHKTEKLIPAVHRALKESENRTMRKKAEKALQENKEQTEALMNATPNVMILIDRDGIILATNKVLPEQLIKNTNEILGMRSFDLLPPDVAEFRKARIEEVFRSGNPSRFEEIDNNITYDTQVYPVFSAGGNVTAVAIHAQDISERQKAEKAIEKYSLNLKRLSKKLIEIQEAERLRISRELHDDIGQSLTIMKITLDLIQNSLPQNISNDTKEKFLELNSQADALLDQIHELILDLRPQMLDDLGLAATLRWLVDRFSKRTHITTKLHANNSGDKIEPEIATTIYRVIQEALTNVAKHAKAKNVKITVTQKEASIEAIIIDNGIGFFPAEVEKLSLHGHGVGLLGMRERINLLDGEFLIESKPGEGTRISLTLPLK